MSRAPEGWWEDSDQLNLVAAFLDPKSIGAVACTCCFTRDNLQDGNVLRWLAELRGLDPITTGITTVEHIAMAEAMSELETSIAFAQGSLDLKEEALPSIRSVVAMLLRHTSLTLSIEAHCGLEPDHDFARHFTQRRAMAVRHAMERIAEEDGAGDSTLDGRLLTRAWGNSRPLVVGYGEEAGGVVLLLIAQRTCMPDIFT